MKLLGTTPRAVSSVEVAKAIFEIGEAYTSKDRFNFQNPEELKKLRFCSVHDAHHTFMSHYGATLPLKVFLKRIKVCFPHIKLHVSRTGCQFFSGIALKPGEKVF